MNPSSLIRCEMMLLKFLGPTGWRELYEEMAPQIANLILD
jgi:hypothetical protein